jgi:hypothetical protein
MFTFTSIIIAIGLLQGQKLPRWVVFEQSVSTDQRVHCQRH